MILITARHIASRKIANFVLNKDAAMDLDYGCPFFQNNFEMVYGMELLAITHYAPERQ